MVSGDNTHPQETTAVNVRQSISLPDKEKEIEKAKKETEATKKTYSLLDFAKFTLPYLWRGGFWIRVQTVITFVLLIVSRLLNVTHPLILKYAIDAISCIGEKPERQDECASHSSTYFLVAMYALVRFLADLVNNIREIPFANVSASAEIHIAHQVYSHT